MRECKRFEATIEDRIVFTTRTVQVNAEDETEAREAAEKSLKRYERINKIEEVSNGT